MSTAENISNVGVPRKIIRIATMSKNVIIESSRVEQVRNDDGAVTNDDGAVTNDNG